MRLRQVFAPPPFVGREPELVLLCARLDAALAGVGSVALLVGEPGIGKTRLAEEVAAHAEERGARVLWGRCFEGEGAPAFWPWVQMLRAYAHGRDAASVAAEFGPYADDIALLLPETPLAASTPPDARGERWGAGMESAAARFRLFDSVAAVLKDAARRRPLLLVIDDLHWADAPSLHCLHFLARELHDAPILLLGAYRDVELDRGDARAQILAGLGRDRRHTRVVLQGMSETEIGTMLAALVDSTPADGSRLARVLHRETEGNPFFVQELIRHLAETGRLEVHEPLAADDGERGPAVPDSIRDVLERRLARLGPACARLLTVAAVLGREFRLAVLSRVADLADVPVLEAMDEALAARIIAPVPGALGRYRFSHALIREALYEATSLAERVRLHRQAGEALEAGAVPGPAFPLAELAHHFSRAALGGDAEKAVRYARRAGDAALARFAYEEAARHYDMALQALDLCPPAEEERCALLTALGDALNRAGETAAARARLLHAAEVAQALAAPERLARVALALSDLQGETGRVDQPQVALLEQALAALGDPGVPELRALLMARLAKARPAHPATATLGRGAVALARRLDDPAVLLDVLFTTRYALWTPDNLGERLANTAEMARLAEAAGDAWWAKAAHALRYSDLIELGDSAAAEAAMAIVARPGPRRQTAHEAWYELVLKAMRELMAGRLAAGEALAWQALVAGQQAGIPDALQSFGVQIAYVRYMQGRFGELEGSIKGLVEQYPETPSWRAALALVYAETGRVAEAREQLERLAADRFAAVPRDRGWLIGIANTAEVCAFLGDAARAAVLYDLLKPYAAQNIVIALATVWYGPVARHLGLLSGTLGRWEDAARHFAAALAMLGRMGCPPLTARVQVEYADLLLRRGRREDRERARALLAMAAATARDLGLDRVITLAAQAAAQATAETEADPAVARGTLPDRLTPREAEVLALIAAGRTNQEIADALTVSPFTIARHITNLYTKIGARGRADATAYALRHGLR